MLRIRRKRILGLGQRTSTCFYHERVVDHYENPRNVGSFNKTDPTVGTGLVGAPACGDVMKLQIKVDNAIGKFVDACFKTFGRGSAIASSSVVANCKLPFAMGITRRLFSADISSLPSITDPDIKAILKDLMAASWDVLPHAVVVEAGIVLSKSTEDRAGQEALANVLRAAEAVEHFAGVLVSLRMELDDSIGINGEKVGRMAEYLQDALDAAYKRYVAYLDAFGPDEVYLRKKVENELGTKMIQIKLRCGGFGSEWGKVTVLGTSGLAGSYVEHRAP